MATTRPSLIPTLQAPILTRYSGLTYDRLVVVRDDMLPGGTKRRALVTVLSSGVEYVYAGPATGYAQMALAYAARDVGAFATVFVAARGQMHQYTQTASDQGATVVQVTSGYLTNVQAKARAYAAQTGATLLPFGLDRPDIIAAIAAIARALPITPPQVWTVSGSGTICRALQLAWPSADHRTVKIGREPSIGRAVLYGAPEPFDKAARDRPPFPSCPTYDAKAWQFLTRHALPGALFWNVGA